jgi:hypothetical protein
VCNKLQRVMFGTPLSCWEARQDGLPCGPDAKLFQPLKKEMQTRKYPRTLQEAFGPHTSREITPSDDNRRKDRITVVGCLLAIAALSVILWLT